MFTNAIPSVMAIPLCHKSSKQGRRPDWLNREHLLELGQKNKMYDLWKQGQASQIECSSLLQGENKKKTKLSLS